MILKDNLTNNKMPIIVVVYSVFYIHNYNMALHSLLLFFFFTARIYGKVLKGAIKINPDLF